MKKKTLKNLTIVGALLLTFSASQLVKADTLSDLKSKESEARSKLNSLEFSRLDWLKKQDVNKPIERSTFPISKTYIDNLKKAYDLNLSHGERQKAEEVLKAESKKLKEQAMSYYKENFVDTLNDVGSFNPNNPTEADKIEFNYFALDIINQIRQQFGYPPLKISTSSLEFADKMKQVYLKKNGSITDWHYAEDLRLLGESYGIKTFTQEEAMKEIGYQAFEDKFATTAYVGSTKKEVKRKIYEGFIEFMYNGHEFDHAQSIAGISFAPKNQDSGYFSLTYAKVKDGWSFGYYQISDELLRNNPNNTFKTTPVADTTQTNREKTKGLLKNYIKQKEQEKSVAQKEYEKYNQLIKAEEERLEKQNQQNQSKPQTNTNTNKPVTPQQNQSQPSKNGWVKEGNTWYYYKNGQTVKNAWVGNYYLKSSGAMASGEWVYDNNYKSWFYLRKDGSYINNQWEKINNVWYHFRSGGYMSSNAWVGNYYLKSSGSMASGEWVYDNNYKSWFYLRKDGSYINNRWEKINNVWYHFRSGGYMSSNAWVGNYYLKSSGAMASNEWIYDNNYKGWYYLKADGSYARNEVVQGRYRVDYSGKWI